MIKLLTGDKQSRTIAAIVRDESARWKEEQGLRRRINDLEKKLASAKV